MYIYYPNPLISKVTFILQILLFVWLVMMTNKSWGSNIESVYSLPFELLVVLDFGTQIKKTFNFVYLLDKNIITNTSNHVSTN